MYCTECSPILKRGGFIASVAEIVMALDHLIVEKAPMCDTPHLARGPPPPLNFAPSIRSISMEEIMLELMYDLPDGATKGAKYMIDALAIEAQKTLSEILVPQKESA